MKPFKISIFSFLLTGFLFFPAAPAICQTYEVNFQDPRSVVNAIFYAAQNRDFKLLLGLCDPWSENDGDTRDLCRVADWNQMAESGDEKSKAKVEEFVTWFGSGEVTGLPEYKENGGETGAGIPILFGPKDQRRTETFWLIQRYGNWYLASF